MAPRRAARYDATAGVDGGAPFGLDLGVASRVPLVHLIIDKLERWEPGGLTGVRRMAPGPVFVHVNGWFRLVAVDDACSEFMPGALSASLVAAMGIGS